MSSLYEMTQNVMYLQDLLENGEIDEQTYRDSVESMCVDGKLENICKFIKNLEAKATAYKVEEDRMARRRKTIENSVKRLKDSLLNYMVSTNEKKVDAGLFTLSLGVSKSVNVWDDTRLPEEYLIPQPPKTDKTAIGKALKDGKVIDGAELVENPYITLR